MSHVIEQFLVYGQDPFDVRKDHVTNVARNNASNADRFQEELDGRGQVVVVEVRSMGMAYLAYRNDGGDLRYVIVFCVENFPHDLLSSCESLVPCFCGQ